jgi:DNA-binding NarL/FixJ family response regulator
VAEQLHLSPKAVSAHKMQLVQKVGIKVGIDNTANSICYASRHNII